MSEEKLNHIVTGVLFDFMGFLTTRKERLVLSSVDDSAPAAEAVEEFLLKRNVEDADPLFQWPDRCNKIDETNKNVGEAMGVLKEAMVDDPEYAWGWHCNIACLLLDEGIEQEAANKRAASFMKNAFDINTYRG